MTETEIESAAGRFRTMIDRSFRSYGVKGGLPDDLKAALRATPRHRFIHRFRLKDDSALHDFDAEPETHLPVVYSDTVMRHVDRDGAVLPSSNSQPSYILWLLHRLGLEPGQRVLDIGSGSGWLAALMGRLVGQTGHVTGIEIIPDVAERSRADLAAAGRGLRALRDAGGGRTGAVGHGPCRAPRRQRPRPPPSACRGGMARPAS